MKEAIIRTNHKLLFFILLTVILYYGRPILIPLFSAVLLTMLMAPFCRWLDHKGWPRTLSALLCVFILLIIFVAMMVIMVGQISDFAKDVSLFEKQTAELLVSVQSFIEKQFNIPVHEQTAFIKSETKNFGEYLRTYLTGLLRSSVQLLAGLIIMLVLTFLFLFHKEKYYSFFLKVASGESQQKKESMLSSIGKVAQHYLVGRAISIITLFILYVVALLIIGIKNALLLAAVAALFNIIPYLGPILAAVFPVLVALVTEQTYQPAIWVLVTFCLFQAFDNYFVTPYFLGGEVSLSALSTIVFMICGGLVWGIAGMILFIPMLSIAKIIFDHVPSLEQYGMLIGDQEGRPTQNVSKWFKKLFSGSRKQA